MKKDELCWQDIPHNLQRILALQYRVRQEISNEVKSSPSSRHITLKVFQTEHPSNLGVLVGLNFLTNKELLSEEHLLQAIQSQFPESQVVKDSFISQRLGSENICTLYLEVKKLQNQPFTAQEMRVLQQTLPTNIQDRIEQLMPSVFMPRNEEEVMRNVSSLSNQIKYAYDLPQVTISFEKQTQSDLFYNLTLVHLRKPETLAMQDLLKRSKTLCEYIHERTKTIGIFRKKYIKEAVLFSVKIPKDQFLRHDRSIDLARARQQIAAELTSLIGHYRDFNGGMISKHLEHLNAVQELLRGHIFNESLLESFYYSLTPDVMKTVLDPKLMSELFLLLLQSIEEGAQKVKRHPGYVLAVTRTANRPPLDFLEALPEKRALSQIQLKDAFYSALVYFSEDSEQQDRFSSLIGTAKTE